MFNGVYWEQIIYTWDVSIAMCDYRMVYYTHVIHYFNYSIDESKPENPKIQKVSTMM